MGPVIAARRRAEARIVSLSGASGCLTTNEGGDRPGVRQVQLRPSANRETTVQSEINEISQVEVEVSVEVPWVEVEKGLEDRLTQVRRTYKVRGFRPGKGRQTILYHSATK